MIAFLEQNTSSQYRFKERLERAGEVIICLTTNDFLVLFDQVSDKSGKGLEAVVISQVEAQAEITEFVATRFEVPVIAMVDMINLDLTKQLFRSGADDVVIHSVHHQELLLRIGSIKRRILRGKKPAGTRQIVVYFDGRDPEILGNRIALPRRERRILEYLALNNGRRVTKAQIFDAVYGMFEQQFNECVVESHICKLRRKLKATLGLDPINTMRHLGYQLEPQFISTGADSLM